MFGWLQQIKLWWQGHRGKIPNLPTNERQARNERRLERIVLTDGVAHTLFDDYTEHRRSERGDEEIGWILLGLRQEGEAIALAALPAGTQRDAGAAHVHFDSDAQSLASRIVRQHDKRLQVVGVVHTHPGNLRSPSGGDLAGDSAWVGQLRGREGVFAIGTADAAADEAARDHLQSAGALCFHWYVLGAGESRYRNLPVKVKPGPDLALPLRSVWSVIETHAESINRLCRQLANVQFAVVDEDSAKLLCVKIGLTEPTQQLRLLLNEGEARYYWDRNGELISIDPHEPQLDRAVYLILAELAKEPAAPLGPSPSPRKGEGSLLVEA